MNDRNIAGNKSDTLGAPWQGSETDEHDSFHGNEDYQQRIAEAAFYNARQRGFVPGNEVSDWLQAAAEVAGLRLRAAD